MAGIYTRLAPGLLQVIELALTVAVVVLVLARRPRLGRHTSFEKLFFKIGHRKTLSIVLVGLFVLVLRVTLIPLLGVPEPRWHDEFSYLLAGDTFAHGQLTNPTHPLWVHFETFHVIQQPTYMSKYPPAQGLALALGQLLGHPWIGQLLTTVLMCSALCWSLQGWLPPAWAFLGGILAALRLGILSYWMNGYWAASIVALGGALVIGALPRIKRSLRVRDAIWMAVGLAILANSRPYEGLLLGMVVAADLGMWLSRARLGIATRRVILPLMLILLVASIATGYYYRRVTGSPFRMAYQVYSATYSRAPFFLWQAPGPEPVFRHAVIGEFSEREFREYQESRTVSGFLRHTARTIWVLWSFDLGPMFTIPLIALPRVARDRGMRFPLTAGAVLLVGIVVETWTSPHYAAAGAALFYIVLMQCMRHLPLWRRETQTGPSLVRAVVLVAFAVIVLRVAAVAAHVQIEPAWPRGNLQRAAILHRLENSSERHLVIVIYGPKHDLNNEWVYNRAEIDSARVVWARDRGDINNQELLRYFHDRQIWRVFADESPPRLESYAEAAPLPVPQVSFQLGITFPLPLGVQHQHRREHRDHKNQRQRR
jgi:hypothetical protein